MSDLVNFQVRMPRGLHSLLMTQARKQGLSLNQYCLYLLTLAAGFKAGREQGELEVFFTESPR